MKDIETTSYTDIRLFSLTICLGLAGIVISLLSDNYTMALGVASIPILLILLFLTLQRPVILFFILFIIQYFFVTIYRILNIDQIGVFLDCLTWSILLIIIIQSALYHNIDWKRTKNVLSIGALIWMIYCMAEIVNPSGMFSAWILSRGLITNGFILTMYACVLINNNKLLNTFLITLSILTLIAVIQSFIQKFMGFNAIEQRWLNGGGYKTHLLATGTRYFSIFSDAGNFGSNMGCASLIFTITGLYIKSKGLKFYYIIIGLLSLYAMFLSGTRGAMIVPLAGLALYIVISKNIKAILSGGTTLLFVYLFFAFTTIGQSNALIRRMRTAFNPTEDASFNVRRDNQKRLAEYLKYKPFGEGLGLSGVENQKTSYRFTTSIPHDSWYVKIWVETGVVGLILYIGFLLVTVIQGCYIIMYKIRDAELKGKLTALLCGIFGLMLSAYGNAFWGQYPTPIIAFTGLAIIMNGVSFDKEIEEKTIIN